MSETTHWQDFRIFLINFSKTIDNEQPKYYDKCI